MPSQSRKATNSFLHTCLQKPSLSQQEDEKPSSNLTSLIADSRRFLATTTATSFPSTQFTNHESLPSLEDAFAQFIDSFPHYSKSIKIDEIRGQEYYHLSLTNRFCLDYFGIGLFAFSQFHSQICRPQTLASTSSPEESQVQPNTSGSPMFSMLYRSVNLKKELLESTHESNLESAIKKRIREFLSISADDYCVVLTANRTAAFKLLSESYPFQSHRKLLTVYDHYREAVEWLKQEQNCKSHDSCVYLVKAKNQVNKAEDHACFQDREEEKGALCFPSSVYSDRLKIFAPVDANSSGELLACTAGCLCTGAKGHGQLRPFTAST